MTRTHKTAHRVIQRMIDDCNHRICDVEWTGTALQNNKTWNSYKNI